MCKHELFIWPVCDIKLRSRHHVFNPMRLEHKVHKLILVIIKVYAYLCTHVAIKTFERYK